MHNLYRLDWSSVMRYRDNFAQPVPPKDWALEFRQAFEDALTKNKGPKLRRAVMRLMKHPDFRAAHGSDDHFIPSCFIAGVIGGPDGESGVLGAETWELTNMCDSQYTFGSWNTSKPEPVMDAQT